jgi:OmpA-OmpF porin, OOP family
MRKILPAVVLPVALAACAGSPPPAKTAAAGPYAQALAAEYQQFARSEHLQMDWPDQALFRGKAQTAAQGTIPAPEDPTKRGVGTGVQIHPDIDLGKQQRAEAIEARTRLLSAIQGTPAQTNPQATARAQVAYDCWVEQLEEGWQKDDIERCRQAFYTAMGQAEARPVAQAAPPQVSAEQDRYQVYFAFDSAQLSDAGQRVVAAAAADIRQTQANEITVVGHADRAGDTEYNHHLSAERAEAVRSQLAAQGIPADRIRTQARGETDPVVETPDDVRQPQNRRAVIDFD